MARQFALILFSMLLYSPAVISQTYEIRQLPQKGPDDQPVPPNNNSCVQNSAECTCCVRGEPHYTTCDGRNFQFNTPDDKIANMASPGAGWWWAVWTWQRFFPMWGKTYVSKAYLRCNGMGVIFLLHPPRTEFKDQAPFVTVYYHAGEAELAYPTNWGDQLPTSLSAPYVMFDRFSPAGDARVVIEVVRKTFPHCGNTFAQEYTYVAAHCSTTRDKHVVSVYARLRMLAIRTNPAFCGGDALKGVCGDFNGYRENDVTQLDVHPPPPWGPLLFNRPPPPGIVP